MYRILCSFRLTTFEIEVISICYAVLNSPHPSCSFFLSFESLYGEQTFQINILNFLFLPLFLYVMLHIYKCIFANLHITCSCWYNHLSICTYNFFSDICRGTKNHNLIDNMNKKLEQTHKKISDVKRKCTETAKTCLQMHVENVSKKKVYFLIAWEWGCAIRSSLWCRRRLYWVSHVLWIRSRNVKDFCALINDCSMIPIFLLKFLGNFQHFHLNILCLKETRNDFFSISINFIFNPFYIHQITHIHARIRLAKHTRVRIEANRLWIGSN